MKIPARLEFSQKVRRLVTIPLGLLFLHLTSSPAFAACDVSPCTETVIGCIPEDLGAARDCFFGIALELLGLLALIMLAAGGYQAMTAGDNPERLQDAKNRITAAITGLFFLLLFARIIRIIGIRILGITPLWDVL